MSKFTGVIDEEALGDAAAELTPKSAMPSVARYATANE
jgi:hypothetical protein